MVGGRTRQEHFTYPVPLRGFVHREELALVGFGEVTKQRGLPGRDVFGEEAGFLTHFPGFAARQHTELVADAEGVV